MEKTTDQCEKIIKIKKITLFLTENNLCLAASSSALASSRALRLGSTSQYTSKNLKKYFSFIALAIVNRVTNKNTLSMAFNNQKMRPHHHRMSSYFKSKRNNLRFAVFFILGTVIWSNILIAIVFLNNVKARKILKNTLQTKKCI